MSRTGAPRSLRQALALFRKKHVSSTHTLCNVYLLSILLSTLWLCHN